MTKIALIAVAALSVTAMQDERWRAGRKFTREPFLIPVHELDQAEVDALRGDPLLVVAEAEIEVQDAEAEDVAKAKEAEDADAKEAEDAAKAKLAEDKKK
jgi:hypothetical protein